METRTSPLNETQLRMQDAQASQVLEIIGGNTLDACKMLEEPNEMDVWFMEMGDDSVFYSDEEQTQQDKDAFESSRCKRLVNSVADCETDQQQAWDPEEIINYKRSFKMEKEATKQVVCIEELKKNLIQKCEKACASDHREAGKCGRPSGMSLQPNCAAIDMQTQQALNKAAKKVKQLTKEEVMLKVPTSNQSPFHAFNEESYSNEKAEISKHLPDAELHQAGNRQLKVDLEVHAGLSQNPNPSRSAPLKSGLSPFNHLTSSKYSTVSYRKIRRGNTQEKIQEFEVMLMNL